MAIPENHLTTRMTFSPLFIGAMAATRIKKQGHIIAENFQSPFHRGNGCYSKVDLYFKRNLDFQSPFHRGNGCYKLGVAYQLISVLSFQSPFHRGNGCYLLPSLVCVGGLWLSVPFSSGQWLLLIRTFRTETGINLSVPFSSGQWLLLT